MLGRIHPPAAYAAIKATFRDLVHRVGGIEAAASVTRLTAGKIAEHYNPRLPRAWPRADVIADLESVAQQPLVTAELARIAGYRLVRLERAADAQDLGTMIGASMREAGDVMHAFCSALQDGRVCAADAAHMQREALEAAASFTKIAAELGEAVLSAVTIPPGAAASCGGGQPGDRRPPCGDDAGRLPQ